MKNCDFSYADSQDGFFVKKYGKKTRKEQKNGCHFVKYML